MTFSVRPTNASSARQRRGLAWVRPAAILVHRWVGLLMAAFLIVAGVTGTVLAFYRDLDAALNPELFRVQPPFAGAPVLEPLELRERIRAQLPGTAVDGLILGVEPNTSVNWWIDDRETFVDPYTGKILGSRKFGELGQGRKGFLTFIYVLHYSLALGEVGTWLFGAIALLWTLDCFVGAYLTFPLASGHRVTPVTRAWLARWAPAWLLKTSRLFSLLFTWHRASGLWVWGMLLVFAWSAVALNLGDQVYRPVMDLVLPARDQPPLPQLNPPRDTPKLDWPMAIGVGRELMAEQARQRRFRVLREGWLSYEAEHAAYAYSVESTLDIDQRLAETQVYFDADTGRLLSFGASTGESPRATLDAWLIALHFGAIREAGYWYRGFVALLGAMVTLLSVTGVWIWWRKRAKRGAGRTERAAS